MAEIVIMPKLGFDMAEGTLVRWVASEGERVEKGAVLAEIETDKATVEVESTYAGVVRHYLVDEDSIVPVGDPIAVIGDPDEEIDLDKLLGESGKQAGTKLKQISDNQELEAVTEEATPTKEVEDSELSSQDKGELPPQEVQEEPEGHLPEGVRASPLARRIADERGIDIRMVKGSGPDGRITKKDVEVYKKAPSPVEKRYSERIPQVVGKPREDQNIPLSRLRAIIGRRMAQSFQQSPHFFVTHEYDVESLIELRQQVNSLLPEDQKISVNDFIIKGVALALREFPNLNASLDEEKNEVIHHGNVNVGVAVAVENGLLTIVCRDTDIKPLRQIAGEIRDMVDRARDGKVRPDDIEGSTFSVSNLGMFDVEQFTAIINPPEAAILAVGSARQVPVVIDGEIKPAIRMKATVSIDHRISDGAEAAQFLQALANFLEEPLRLLI
jgi:pyruvate dehydrogenase E2 component (dihydrolipoamide acetyltransferase)